MKIKILIISQTAWREDNSFGSSFSNIFWGVDNLEIVNIYCNYGNPQNSFVKKYFQITEKSIINNLLNANYPSGREVFQNDNAVNLNKNEVRSFNHVRQRRLQIYFWLRDCIWKFGRWKSRDLEKFITEFKPDLIFQPLYYSNYINDIVLYAHKLTKVPMVCYVSDDVYTLKQYSLSPFYWIDRFIKRPKIKKVVELCEYMYVISDIQKQDYEKCFKKQCKVLTKGAEFNLPQFKSNLNQPLKLVYTGNIGAGRWKSLAMIADELKELNKDKILAQLVIYSPTPMTQKMKKALTVDGSVCLMGAVSSNCIPDLQMDADVLVHVEPLDLKGRLQVRQSFSTKIVDYFHAGRAILAVGWTNAASIDYLIKNDAALVAFDEKSISEQLQKIVDNPEILSEYAQKAWECGKRNHQISEIQNNLYNDLQALVNKNR